MKHLKTLLKTQSMVNGVDLCLLNNVFSGFHISGVCSDICSFTRVMR